MPSDFRPYTPAARSRIRERLIENLSRQEVALKERSELTAIQAANPSLSPVDRRLLLQHADLVDDFRLKVSNSLKAVRAQNALSDQAETELKLRPSRLRLGLEEHRSSRDRNLAILGLLDRERRRTAPLTRAALGRAQAVAASRKRYDPTASALRGSRGSDYAVGFNEALATGPSAFAEAGVDPCEDYLRIQRNRRETMFAQGVIGRGRRGFHSPHQRGPC